MTKANTNGERYSRLLVANQRRIYGFILALVHDRNHADDLQQEVAAVLWNKFDQYEDGTDFAAWAMRVARLCVYEWRRKQSKLPLPMSEATFELLSEDAIAMSCEFDDRVSALRGCLGKLSERHQQLLSARYHENEPVRAIAERFGRTRRAIYKSLEKIHTNLLACIRRQLAENPG